MRQAQDAAADRGRTDIVEDLAVPLPVIVIAELLGVPPEDRKLFKKWSDALVEGAEENERETIGNVLLEKQQTLEELTVYFQDMIAIRRSAPKTDLISLLLAAEIDGKN